MASPLVSIWAESALPLPHPLPLCPPPPPPPVIKAPHYRWQKSFLSLATRQPRCVAMWCRCGHSDYPAIAHARGLSAGLCVALAFES